mmetsp:Transcript_118555/g.232859  ORF Transcript_118555/g.232859 Transcript_118555/m.232859 type:complete len:133 (+) Transcript_118555:316-714(+)
MPFDPNGSMISACSIQKSFALSLVNMNGSCTSNITPTPTISTRIQSLPATTNMPIVRYLVIPIVSAIPAVSDPIFGFESCYLHKLNELMHDHVIHNERDHFTTQNWAAFQRGGWIDQQMADMERYTRHSKSE